MFCHVYYVVNEEKGVVLFDLFFCELEKKNLFICFYTQNNINNQIMLNK